MFSPSVHLRTHYKLCLVGLVVMMYLFSKADGQDISDRSHTTADHMKDPGWWPTKGTAARSEFAGSAVCAGCHRGITEPQKQTAMSKAACRPAQDPILRQTGKLVYRDDGYNYELVRQGTATKFSVNDASRTLTVPVEWVIGNGEIGQTFLLKQDNTYFESRLSYFSRIFGLDITPGHPRELPNALELSLGIPMDIESVERCLGCHTTESIVSGIFNPQLATPGVGCEACHGPGAAHIKAMKQDGDSAPLPLNPKNLSPVDSVDFCGACHHTSAEVLATPGGVGMIGIRFQPYRLELSRCWGTSGDARITCLACHNPHKPLVKDTASYDSKCLQCHAKTGNPAEANQAPSCTVAAANCASCHMPRYEIGLAHATLTDHYIHIVRPSEGYRY
jgi:hypothetical protein